MKKLQSCGWLAVAAMAGAASAAPPPPSSDIVKSMLACRGITDAMARLACFDSKSAVLDTATAKGEVAVIDRETVRQAKRQNFGRQIIQPIVSLGEKDVVEIDAVVGSAAPNSDGGWMMTMTDGSRWLQTDSTLLGRPPRSGSKVKIRRGALGSYKMAIEGGPGIKVQRVG